MEITWLGILAIAILIFTGYGGYRKGFVREIMSFFFVFLALALAWMINPYVNDFMMKKTPAYERIQESCLNLIYRIWMRRNQTKKALAGKSWMGRYRKKQLL